MTVVADASAAVDGPKMLLESLSQTTGDAPYVTDSKDLYFDDKGYVFRGDFVNGPQKLGEAPGNLTAMTSRQSRHFSFGSTRGHGNSSGKCRCPAAA